MRIKPPSRTWDVHHPEHGPGRSLGPGPDSYSKPHTVVKLKTGIIMRIPDEELTFNTDAVDSSGRSA